MLKFQYSWSISFTTESFYKNCDNSIKGNVLLIIQMMYSTFFATWTKSYSFLQLNGWSETNLVGTSRFDSARCIRIFRPFSAMCFFHLLIPFLSSLYFSSFNSWWRCCVPLCGQLTVGLRVKDTKTKEWRKAGWMSEFEYYNVYFQCLWIYKWSTQPSRHPCLILSF